MEDQRPTMEQLAYLNQDGDLLVPCSRYGRSTFECSPFAVSAARVVANETGEELGTDLLDQVMGLVVNDHDDPEYLITQYGDPGDPIDAECISHLATQSQA